MQKVCQKVLPLQPMYKISHHVAAVDAADYVRRYRDVPKFLTYCRECSSYGHVWSCPPFEGDVEAMTQGFKQATIWGTNIEFDETTRSRCTSDEQRRNISREAIEEAWRTLLPFIYSQEEAHPGSRAFPGRCRLGQPAPCSRIEGKPCRQPERMRSSLEAVGFDVSATARDVLGIELLWSTDGRLPERITLVTALFSHDTFAPTLPPLP